jgi:hypothetical protein
LSPLGRQFLSRTRSSEQRRVAGLLAFADDRDFLLDDIGRRHRRRRDQQHEGVAGPQPPLDLLAPAGPDGEAAVEEDVDLGAFERRVEIAQHERQPALLALAGMLGLVGAGIGDEDEFAGHGAVRARPPPSGPDLFRPFLAARAPTV